MDNKPKKPFRLLVRNRDAKEYIMFKYIMSKDGKNEKVFQGNIIITDTKLIIKKYYRTIEYPIKWFDIDEYNIIPKDEYFI